MKWRAAGPRRFDEVAVLDLRCQALAVLNPPNPTGSLAFTTTGTNSPTVTGSGNPFASLLLGQVNAFTIDVQQNVIQPRAHIAEFFVADDWKLSPRLTLNIGTRYTLNFPSTEMHNQGAVFNLGTQVLDFPHTARELACVIGKEKMLRLFFGPTPLPGF